ncbi:transcriptional regulator with XRE-family HTH domain [Catenuloplanes nepalensis]|uniref:Transcriptional regulator with XRE-family HTH domain n=1 Tax=Catenuloplanes nepalensis TaxID=587533 RepID=A0ABT9MS48_9ACTN|nr:helix-turn-helix transcriptional regulator [Catenuloplanes nepalensis]MDP9794270.1 transcriptional regulator with XRE-family HTH domain [Catenuloplanes nepalensis]
MTDRARLAGFLRARREALRPEEVGLPRGSRRRTGGLRREEVAALAGISVDYYNRIEQQRGSVPSEPVLGGLARALRLSLSERDHLYRLAGFPQRIRDDHPSPVMMRIVDDLSDVPAVLFTRLGVVLLQTRPAVALIGDWTRFTGLSRYLVYRWFTDPVVRDLHPAEDRPPHGRDLTARLRAVHGTDPGGPAGEIVAALLADSPEFAEIWRRHEADVVRHHGLRRLLHPQLGELELYCTRILDPVQSHRLLVFTAVPGSPSQEKLRLLAAVGE